MPPIKPCKVEQLTGFDAVFGLEWKGNIILGNSSFGEMVVLGSVLMGLRVNSESEDSPQSVFTCSKFTIETLEQGVKYVQS